MIKEKHIKFILLWFILLLISTIRINYQLQVNNYIYWKIGNFLVDNRYNFCLLSIFFLLKNKYIYLFLYYMLDEFCWLDLNIANNIKSFNTLTNGFFVIHPVLILLSFSITITVLLKMNKKYLHNIYINNNRNIFTVLLIVLLSGMFLGSYWANQEVGWGGWWSWDYVENINLILFLITLLSVHKKEKNKNLNTIFNKKLLVLFVIFLHLCVRLDLGDSIHSFIQTNEIEYVYLVILLLNLILYFNFTQNTIKYNNINILNISYHFIIVLFILLSACYLFYFQNYNYKTLFILIYIMLTLYILTSDTLFINFLIFDFWFFSTLCLFKIFNKAKSLEISLAHFIIFSILIMLSLNYLELTLYYSKKNTTIFNIINLGDFIYNLRIEELNKSYINWFSNNNVNSNWNFFFSSEIFFYKYLYEFKNTLTSDNIFLSYSNNTFQVYIYSIYILIFIIKNTSIDYKYKRLCM